MAVEIDPDTYALQVQLQLNSTEALRAFDDFSTTVSDLETRISAVAQQVLSTSARSVSSLDSAFEFISTNLQNISRSLVGSNASLSDTVSNAFDYYDAQADQLRQTRSLYNQGQLVAQQNEDLNETLDDQVSKVNEFLNSTQEIIDAVRIKNAEHRRQNTLVDQGADNIEAQVRNAGNLNRQYRHGHSALAEILNSLRRVWAITKEIDKATEEFVTHNFRAYGSQYDLLRSTYSLSAAYGILEEKSIAAYKLLMNLRIPRTELHRLAGVVAMANRTTGAGVEVLALFAARLRKVGMAADGIETQIVRVTESMRKFGLNTEDVQSILSKTAAMSYDVAALFGAGEEGTRAKAIADWNDLTTAVAGFGREFGGFSASDFDQFWGQITDPAMLAKFEMYAGRSINNMDDLKAATVSMALRAQREFTNMERVYAGQPMRLAAWRKAWIDTYFAGNEAAAETMRSLGRLAESQGVVTGSLTDYDKLVRAFTEKQMDQWDESNNTLTAQLRILSTSLSTIRNAVMSLVADGLVDLFRWLNYILTPIAKFITEIIALTSRLKASHPVIYSIIASMISMMAIVTLVGGAIGGLVITMALFHGAATAMGTAIVNLFTSFGQGLQRLGTLVQPVMVPLLALAGAVVLVGVGSLFLAMAIERIANAGAMAIPVMLGMTLMLGLIAGGLVFFGLMAEAAAPGILVLAIGMVALGATAWILAQAVSVVADSMDKLADVAIKLAVALGPTHTAAMAFDLLTAVILFGAVATLAGPVAVALGATAPLLVLALLPLGLAASMMEPIGAKLYLGSRALRRGFVDLLHANTAIGQIRWRDFTSAAFGIGLALVPLGTVANSVSPIGASLEVGGAALMRGTFAIVDSADMIAEGARKLRFAATDMDASVRGILVNIRRTAAELDAAILALESPADNFVASLSDLHKQAADMTIAVDAFEKPTNRFIALLSGLGEAIVGLNDITVSESITRVTTMIESQADALSMAVTRLEAAMALKARASQMAREHGLATAVPAQPISRVAVVMEQEGGEAVADHAADQIELLRELNDKLTSILGNKDLSQIIQLLTQYLPNLEEDDHQLANQLNSWM